MAEKKFTPKQEKFIAEYLLDFNATRAAAAAGYSTKSQKSIQRTGSELLSHPLIAAEIEKRRKATLDSTENLRERIQNELIAIAFANGTDYAEILEGGLVQFKPTASLSAEKKAALASIEASTTGTKVKTHDKLKAIELLSKMAGLLEQGPGGRGASLADSIRQAYEKRMAEEDE